MRTILIAVVTAAIVATGGCSSKDDSTASTCESEPIAAFKELMIVDEGVLTDPRSMNETAGAWSFRHAVENMAPPSVDPGDFTRDWFRGWVSTRTLNGFPLDLAGEERDAGMERIVLCPWMRATPSNGCTADCGSCAAEKLDMSKAPFRLIAIVNRIDLREQVESEQAGEGRLLFALTSGPGDDPASAPLALVLNFEYRHGETRTAKEWAEAWHALGAFATTDEPYRAALQQVTDGFTKRGARPAGVNGSSLGQVRTNDSALDWIWQLRQFELNPADGMLGLTPLRNTPGEALNGSDVLREYLSANGDKVRSNRYELPASLRSGSTDALRYRWSVPQVDEPTRKAFAGGTCNGCHGSELTTVVDTAFHVSPFRKGLDKLSPFVWNAAAPEGDELTTRTKSMRRALCGN